MLLQELNDLIKEEKDQRPLKRLDKIKTEIGKNSRENAACSFYTSIPNTQGHDWKIDSPENMQYAGKCNICQKSGFIKIIV